MTIVNEARAVLTAEDRASHVLAMVARNFDRLNNAANRMERVGGGARGLHMIEQQTSRMNRMMAATPGLARQMMGPLAGVGAVYFGGKAMSDAARAFAANERAMTRIGITAESTQEQERRAWRETQELSREVALPVAEVRKALDALVAAGRSLPDAMAFLPSVARTAQAAGAQTDEIARSADAVGNAFRIAGPEMQHAFDIMAAGGKAGKFELKDMARYLPELAPAAAAVGLQGTAGLKQLVAMLQVIRNQTGSAEEAATSLKNIFAKMESDKTVGNFEEFGIDLEKSLAKGRAEGKNLLTVFTELTNQALKGDMSKIPKLFADMEFARGMRALASQPAEMSAIMDRLGNVQGTVGRDLDRVLANRQASIDRMKASFDRLADTLGNRLAPGFRAVVDNATAAADAMEKALRPGETDQERLARIGNKPMTRAEKSAADAERALARQRNLDDPGSDYYTMRDGGFAAARMEAERRKPGHKISTGAIRLARERRLADAERHRKSQQARFLSSERAYGEEQRGFTPRSEDVYRDVDALSQQRRRVSADDHVAVRTDLQVERGNPMTTQVLAGLMNLAQAVRGHALLGQGEANFHSLAGPGAIDGAKVAIENAIRQMAYDQEQKTGQPVSEDAIRQVIDQLTGLAQRIGETVPQVGPKGRVDGLAQGVAEALTGLKAEVKPDQITAKADVSVDSQVSVRVEPTSELLRAVAEAKSISRQRPSGGLSMPHKEGLVRPGQPGY